MCASHQDWLADWLSVVIMYKFNFDLDIRIRSAVFFLYCGFCILHSSSFGCSSLSRVNGLTIYYLFHLCFQNSFKQPVPTFWDCELFRLWFHSPTVSYQTVRWKSIIVQTKWNLTQNSCWWNHNTCLTLCYHFYTNTRLLSSASIVITVKLLPNWQPWNLFPNCFPCVRTAIPSDSRQ
jgi:hypothetical protein